MYLNREMIPKQRQDFTIKWNRIEAEVTISNQAVFTCVYENYTEFHDMDYDGILVKAAFNLFTMDIEHIILIIQ